MRREDTAPPAALRAQGRQGHAVLEISTSLLHPQPASPRPRSKFHLSFGTPPPAAPSLCPSSEMPHHRALSSGMPAPPPPRAPPPGRPTDLVHLPDQVSSVQSGQEPAAPARAPRGTSLHTQGPKEPPVQTQGGSTRIILLSVQAPRLHALNLSLDLCFSASCTAQMRPTSGEYHQPPGLPVPGDHGVRRPHTDGL